MLQCVASLLSLFRIGDKIGLFQYCKVLADVRLGALKQFPYVLHAQWAFPQYFKDGQSGRVRQCFQEFCFFLQLRT